MASVLLLVVLVYPQITHTWKHGQIFPLLKEKVVQLDQTLIQPTMLQITMVQVALPSSKPLLEVLTSLDQVKRQHRELYDLKRAPACLQVQAVSD